MSNNPFPPILAEEVQRRIIELLKYDNRQLLRQAECFHTGTISGTVNDYVFKCHECGYTIEGDT